MGRKLPRHKLWMSGGISLTPTQKKGGRGGKIIISWKTTFEHLRPPWQQEEFRLIAAKTF